MEEIKYNLYNEWLFIHYKAKKIIKVGIKFLKVNCLIFIRNICSFICLDLKHSLKVKVWKIINSMTMGYHLSFIGKNLQNQASDIDE
jgi:hypothetical protein